MKILSWVTAWVVLVAGAASAQPRACAPRDVVLDRLAVRYGEARKAIGLGANAQMVEVFASEDSGTWTIIVTSPSGLTCLIASGSAFEAMTDPVPANDDDA